MIAGLGKIVPESVKYRARRKFKNLFFRAHTQLGRSKYLLNIYSALGINQDLVVTPSTQLVIEGAARTATTYAYYGILVTQPLPLSIAYHIHLPAQVLRSLELNIPVLVTIRDPRDAVASAIVREPYMSIKAYLERYLVFYEILEPYSSGFVVADFAEVVNEFPSVMKRLNIKYGCNYVIPEDFHQFNFEVVSCLEQHHQSYGGGVLQSYLPNPAKNLAKSDVDFTSQQPLLARCEAMYRRYLSGFT